MKLLSTALSLGATLLIGALLSCDPQTTDDLRPNNKHARIPGPGSPNPPRPYWVCEVGDTAYYYKVADNEAVQYQVGYNGGQGLRGIPYIQRPIGYNTSYKPERFTSMYDLPTNGLSQADKDFLASAQNIGGFHFTSDGVAVAYTSANPSFVNYLRQKFNSFSDPTSTEAVAHGLGLVDGLDNADKKSRRCLVGTTWQKVGYAGGDIYNREKTLVEFIYSTNPGEDPW